MALWTRVVWIWTWCARGRTRGDSPQSAGLGKLGDRSSRHPVCLVWVNGSFGCRTIAARTRDLILDTVPLITNIYRSYLFYYALESAA